MLNSKLFQFYDSPIKSSCSLIVSSPLLSFQFYDSPIKSIYKLTADDFISTKFQFYDSPIKSHPMFLGQSAVCVVSIL